MVKPVAVPLPHLNDLLEENEIALSFEFPDLYDGESQVGGTITFSTEDGYGRVHIGLHHPDIVVHVENNF